MPPVARTALGDWIGQEDPRGLSVFRGVRFAQPPVGDLRQREPEPIEGRSGARQAVEFSDAPLQRPAALLETLGLLGGARVGEEGRRATMEFGDPTGCVDAPAEAERRVVAAAGG